MSSEKKEEDKISLRTELCSLNENKLNESPTATAKK
jgi:hypothetical protein